MSRFAILTVCSGNLCRSPVAEQVLRARLARLISVTVGSVGTAAVLDASMPAQAAALSIALGGDPAGHVPRALAASHVRRAALVLAMSREHRREVVSLVPGASRKTFTLREFARLIDGAPEPEFAEAMGRAGEDGAAPLRALVEFAARRRGLAPPIAGADDDVVDPFGQPDSVYERTGEQLAPALETIAVALARAARL